MGVPGFFLWLHKRYKKTNFVFNKYKLDNEELLDKVNNIDYLLIDANCLIHPKCFEVLAEYPDYKNQDSLENKMINAVLEYIDKLIEYANPKKGVYLAIDGVAPVAKIKQQRYRRFKSVHDKILFDNIRLKHNKDVHKSWNNSAITPGTVFMEKLHHRILNWAKSKKTKKIIYSSCKTPAEGEHKLLQFIRDNTKNNIQNSYVMYGLDADLIFLCLSTNCNNMFLLREENQIDEKKKSNDLNYVSLDIMRESIIDTIENIAQNNDKLEDARIIDLKYSNNLINDFVFICYLLGNDFLPHLPSLDIYSNGLDVILNKYVEVLADYNYKKFIIERTKTKVNINTKLFIEFMSFLSSEESEILKNSFLNKRKYHKSSSTDPYDVEMHRINNVYFKVKDPIQLGSDESELWKKRYYQYHFHLNDDEIESYVDKLVYEYLMGLKWVTNYYFDKCSSWSWYYPFDYPPFLEDITSFLEKNKTFSFNKFKFEIGTPLKPFNQLLLVLPPQSSYLMTRELKKIINNPKSSISYLYPTQIQQDLIGKKKYWMAQPILPSLDLKLVKRIYLKYEKSMSEEDKRRNNRLDIFEFN
tara:strand:- start:6423 stop:8174 length:1752 start_codon:yes stop_codon:yes gene_type:complete